MRDIRKEMMEEIGGRIRMMKEVEEKGIRWKSRDRREKRKEMMAKVWMMKEVLYGNREVGDEVVVSLWDRLVKGLGDGGDSVDGTDDVTGDYYKRVPSELMIRNWIKAREMRNRMGEWSLRDIGMESPIKGFSPGFFRGLELGGAIKRNRLNKRKRRKSPETEDVSEDVSDTKESGMTNSSNMTNVSNRSNGYKNCWRMEVYGRDWLRGVLMEGLDRVKDGGVLSIRIGEERENWHSGKVYRVVGISGGIVGMRGDEEDGLDKVAGLLMSGHMEEVDGGWVVRIYGGKMGVNLGEMGRLFDKVGIGYEIGEDRVRRKVMRVSCFWLGLYTLIMDEWMGGEILKGMPGVKGGRCKERGWVAKDCPLLAIWWWDRVYGGGGVRGIESGLVPFLPGRKAIWERWGGDYMGRLHLEGVKRGWGIGGEGVRGLFLKWGERHGKIGRRW